VPGYRDSRLGFFARWTAPPRLRVGAKINSEECRRDFGGRRGARDEHIQGICKEGATKRAGKGTRRSTEIIFARTLSPISRVLSIASWSYFALLSPPNPL
jgi:hypothetical protein